PRQAGQQLRTGFVVGRGLGARELAALVEGLLGVRQRRGAEAIAQRRARAQFTEARSQPLDLATKLLALGGAIATERAGAQPISGPAILGVIDQAAAQALASRPAGQRGPSLVLA